jgi:hypothetical protein
MVARRENKKVGKEGLEGRQKGGLEGEAKKVGRKEN